MSDALKLSATLPPGPARSHLLALVRGSSRPERWRGLGMGFDVILDRFERFQIGAMVALLSGADPDTVEALQESAGREVLETLVGRLPPDLATSLQKRLEDNGPLMFHHHAMREIARRADDASEVFAASGACQLAAIGLDAEIRSLKADPRKLLEARDAALVDVARRAPVDALPLGGLTLAVLWAATLARVGRQRLEDETTEHYAV